MVAHLTGKIYPSKKFSVGIVPKKKKTRQDAQYERDRLNQPEIDHQCEIDWLTEKSTIGGKFNSIKERALFIKGPKSSQAKRGKYGKHGITNFGRRFIENACILLEQQYGKRKLGFATATLPSMDRDTLNTINGKLSDITRRFYQKIRRKYQARGCEFIYVGCVEIQEKRFARTRLPVPHLHFVYLAKSSVSAGYVLNTEGFYTAWNESVNAVLINSGLSPIMGIGGHKGSVKVEPIRTSAASYIGKYVSKGCKVVEAMKEKGFEDFPKQWWTACKRMKAMYKNSIIRMDAAMASAIYFGLEHFMHEEYITWGRFVEVEIDGEYRKMGVVGRFSDEMYAMIKE